MSEKLDPDSASKLLTALQKTEAMETDGSLEGLSERQQIVMQLRRRGWSIRAIANSLGISPTYTHQITKEARAILAQRVTEQSVAEHVSDAVSVYEEVEHEAFNMMTEKGVDPNIKLRAMTTAMAARDKQVKLLMDLGYIERVAQKTETNVTVSVLQNWEDNLKKQVSAHLIESQLQPLAEPTPLLEGDVVDVDPPKKRAPLNEEQQLAELVGEIEFDDDDEDE